MKPVVRAFEPSGCVPAGMWAKGTVTRRLSALIRCKALARLAFAVLLSVVCGCGPRPGMPSANQNAGTAAPTNAVEARQRVRAPAVAGLFYPGEERDLSKAVDGLLEAAPVHYIPRLRGLVCPHAGYVYSGQTAAIAYKTAAGRSIETVVVMGPSHYALFQQASLPNADVYQTPLGKVPISDKAALLLKATPFVQEPRCLVQRPDWWRQSPKAAPAAGEDSPDTWEHSVEVQVPFLQKALKNFKLVPVVVGDADPQSIAAGLAKIVDDHTLVVASSDLSHYHPYADAKALDERCVKAICDMDVGEMQKQEACGKLPILALMQLARQKGWKAELLDCRNSGDVSGQKDRVVGYSAIAFYEPVPEKVSAADRRFLLNLARQSLVRAATNGPPPEVSGAEVSPALSEAKGSFVTLTVNGVLRGCIGNILPQGPLYRAVADNAQNAALRDPRFRPVRSNETGQIRIEVSVLTVPEPLRFTSPEDLLSKLKSYEDGVVLQIGARGATFLPQVWAQIPDKVDFLNQLSQKAGCPAAAWRGADTSVSIYHVESFEEPE